MQFKYQIPDLSSLERNSVKIVMAQIFMGASVENREGNALVINFVRLVDLAVQEYEFGRKSVSDFVASRELGYFILASGYFEECISTTQRASLHLKRIVGYPYMPSGFKDLFPAQPLVLNVPGKIVLSDIRGAITHVEERLLGISKKGPKIVIGESIMLYPEETRLTLGNHEVLYSDLSNWLEELHGIATKLTKYR